MHQRPLHTHQGQPFVCVPHTATDAVTAAPNVGAHPWPLTEAAHTKTQGAQWGGNFPAKLVATGKKWA